MRYPFAVVSIMSLLVAACGKENVPLAPAEAYVIKTINYTVCTGADYTGSFYNNANGQLELNISKISNSGTVEVLWDTVFIWRKLSDFPSFQNSINMVKSFPVLDSKDKIQVSSVRKYNINGMLSQTAIGEPVPQGNATVEIKVNL